MTYYFNAYGWHTTEVLPDRSTDIAPPDATLPDGYAWNFTGYEWVSLERDPRPIPAPTSPTQWLIDIGPFFDRFGAAKMSILVSTNATVKAIAADLQVRKWVDLKRPDVAAGIDALIALGVPGVTSAVKTAVLTTPVTADENLALRKLYF